MLTNSNDLFCTKTLSRLTGMSASFYEKGRIYGYGPPYRKLRGRVLYKRLEVEAWLDNCRTDPTANSEGSTL